jgi:hypothetical protein
MNYLELGQESVLIFSRIVQAIKDRAKPFSWNLTAETGRNALSLFQDIKRWLADVKVFKQLFPDGFENNPNVKKKGFENIFS